MRWSGGEGGGILGAGLGLPGSAGLWVIPALRLASPCPVKPGASSLSKAVQVFKYSIDYCKWAYEPYRLRFVSAGELFILNKYVFNNL